MSFPFSYPVYCETGGYNELLAENGEVRPHWRNFFDAVEQEGKEKLLFYAEQTARLMNADILAAAAKHKNMHGVIPFILPYEEFKALSAGLIQRAELINKTLADLYGEQKLIEQGILPPEVIFGNPFKKHPTGGRCFFAGIRRRRGTRAGRKILGRFG